MQRRMGTTSCAYFQFRNRVRSAPAPKAKSDIAMTRDQLNRELRARNASFPAVLIVYAIIVGTMILTGLAMT